MPVSATSVASIPIQALAATVAASTTFQTLVGAEDAAEAIGHVYYLEADDRRDSDADDMANDRPRAIVTFPTHRIEQVGLASLNHAGSLELSLEAEVPSEHQGNKRQEALWFANTYGAIVDEMFAAAWSDPSTYLNMRAAELVGAPIEVRHECPRPFWEVVLRIEWFG